MEQALGQIGPAEWLGYPVFVKYMAGPDYEHDPDDPKRIVKGQLEARAGVFILQKIGLIGVELRRQYEQQHVFILWGSVLSMQGLPEEEREKIRKKVEDSPT